MPLLIQAAVFRPLAESLTYEVDEAHAGLGAGSLLDLPLGRGTCRGVSLTVPAYPAAPLPFTVKTVRTYLPPEYALPADLLRLAEWMSAYYLCPPGDALSAMSCPQPLAKPAARLPEGRTEIKGGAPNFTSGQSAALAAIQEQPVGRPVLLHGVTGSGKTELYMRLVEDCLADGRSAILLVPEITLTRELLRKLEARFASIIVVHSAMTPKARREAWLLARSAGPHLVIGARSCVFSPLVSLGLIVVDEEHDHSYKQDSSPRYQARDLAVVRASQAGARVVLGSATPSLESFRNAETGKYALVGLPERVLARPLPKVRVVDMREERRAGRSGGVPLFSRHLLGRLRAVLAEKKQAILFLNRRGFSTFLRCSDCGETVQCPSCSVSLVYYKRRNLLQCHHCGHEAGLPERCVPCGGRTLLYRGTGTERVHELLGGLLPGATVVRVDGSAEGHGKAQERLAAFMGGEGDILLGTQLVGKGLDSPRVRLSAALDADQGLGLPDFRAAERDFQLLTQLAGRSGRGEEPGECVFQSRSPEHYAIRHALAHDYAGFYRQECEFRRRLSYPPFARLARLVLSSTAEERLDAVQDKAAGLRALAGTLDVALLGPAPAPLERVKGRHRRHLLAKCADAGKLGRFLRAARDELSGLAGVDLVLDRDPQDMM